MEQITQHKKIETKKNMGTFSDLAAALITGLIHQMTSK